MSTVGPAYGSGTVPPQPPPTLYTGGTVTYHAISAFGGGPWIDPPQPTPQQACEQITGVAVSLGYTGPYTVTTTRLFELMVSTSRRQTTTIAWALCYASWKGTAYVLGDMSPIAGCPAGYQWNSYYATSFETDYCIRLPDASSCPAHSTGMPAVNPTTCTCDDPYVPDAAGTSCVLPSCPANSSGTPCVCDPGYQFDVAGTSCVPVVPCLIPELTTLTDPIAIDFDNNPGNRWRPDGLTATYQAHVRCVEDQTRARGGTPIGTSAYRPEQYQRHLFEIVQKDRQLNTDYMTAHPECQALRNTITQKMGPSPGHGLRRGQLVATPGTSRHESGTAFDMTLTGLTSTQEAAVYSTCRVTRTAVRNEPWHTQ